MPTAIRKFDPALSRSGADCGPGVDPESARVAADLDWLRRQGVRAARYNLSRQPFAFADSHQVQEALAEVRGLAARAFLVPWTEAAGAARLDLPRAGSAALAAAAPRSTADTDAQGVA